MKLLNLRKQQSGFTLIELLVVIGILAILLAITLIAINPNKHFQDTRNAKRSSDVSAILDAIYEYESANNGSQPASVASVSTATDLGGINYTGVSASFAGGNVTYTVPSGNIVTSGKVDVSGCDQAADNGTAQTVLSGTSTTIVIANASGATATGCTIKNWDQKVDLCADLVPTFIAELPTDPDTAAGGSFVTGGATPCATATTSYGTGYQIAKANGRFTISAPHAEGTATISVTR